MSWYSQSLCGRHFGLPCSHWRGFCGKAPSSCPLHSGKRLRPSTRVTAPSWDLAIVLEGLVMTPFEPLESAPIRFLTLKMFFNGHYFSYENRGFAGSVNLAILPRLCPWAGQSYFAPSPNYLPKVPWIRSFLKLSALRRSRHRSRKDFTYCVQYVLFGSTSTALASGVSRSNFSYAMGAAATEHTVSHWVRDAIALAYEARGQASPLRVRAHSTRGVASSMALARGAPLQQVCDAAG